MTREKKEVVAIIEKLQELKKIGNNDAEIEAVIKSLDLPFDLHMYIMSNYSRLMSLSFE